MTAARVPSAPLDEPEIEVLRLLAAVFRWGEAYGGALVRRHGHHDAARNLPIIVLATLATDGPLRPARIADLTGLSSGGVTALLDRLESRGLVHRSLGERPDDRRAVVVELTEQGRRVVLQMIATVTDPSDAVRMRLRELLAAFEAVRRRGENVR
jgi:DNA-binding MarR family transcriptional regulator